LQVHARYGQAKTRGAEAEAAWAAMMDKYTTAYPDLAAELKRRIAGELPTGWKSVLPRYTPKDAAQATRCAGLTQRG
jgi:transketolase